MRLSGLLVVTIAGLATALPATAHAQSSAPTPCDGGFAVERPEFVNTVDPVRLDVTAPGGDRVDVDWGDGATGSEPAPGGRAAPAHQYRAPGSRTITLTATDTCSGRPRTQVIRLPVDVNPSCDERRDVSVFLVDCEEERGTLYVRNPGALTTTATWTNPPCRDQPYQGELVRPQARARAAACTETVPTPVEGRLPVRPGRRVGLELRAPADAVSVRVGTVRGPSGRRIRARRVGSSDLRWRAALPAGLDRRTTRLYVVARRAGGATSYLAGLRVR